MDPIWAAILLFFFLVADLPCVLSVESSDGGDVADYELFDYIVVGGGAGGCSIASTLIYDADSSVLILERGKAYEEVPLAQNAATYPMVLTDPTAAEVIPTANGVLAITARVMGGGTAINGAVFYRENERYFNILREKYGVDINKVEFEEAYDFIEEKLGHPSRDLNPTMNMAIRDAMVQSSFTAVDPSVPSPMIQNGSTWAYSAFDNPSGQRHTAYHLLPKSAPNLDIRLEASVQKVIFGVNPDTNKLEAQCVLYQINSNLWPSVHDPEGSILSAIMRMMGNAKLGLQPVAEYFGFRLNEAAEASTGHHTGIYRKACIRAGGKIVLSAGTIWTPILLYRSGVGPKDLLEDLKIPVTMHVHKLGQNLQDRPLFALTSFAKDEVGAAIQESIWKYNGIDYFDINTANPVEKCEESNDKVDCQFISLEGTLGGTGITNAAVVSRVLMPPFLRTNPAVEKLFYGLSACPTDTTSPYGLLNCGLMAPLGKCREKVVGNVIFVNEPRSVGRLGMYPDGMPMVDFNYFDDPRDMKTIKAAARKAQEVLQADALKPYLEPAGTSQCGKLASQSLPTTLLTLLEQPGLKPALESRYSPIEFLQDSADDTDEDTKATVFPAIPKDTKDDTKLELIIRSFFSSSYHYVGTAAMNSVVDENCNFIGIDNLMVADASVLPHITRMNTAVTVEALGIYCGKRHIRMKK